MLYQQETEIFFFQDGYKSKERKENPSLHSKTNTYCPLPDDPYFLISP